MSRPGTGPVTKGPKRRCAQADVALLNLERWPSASGQRTDCCRHDGIRDASRSPSFAAGCLARRDRVGAAVIVAGNYVIPDAELTWRFSRSSGPGGQNVNTTDTRVQLSFDLAGSDAFPDALKQRMLTRLGDQVVVVAAEHRSQLRNRRAAEVRLAELLEAAMKPPPPPRVPTKPSKGSQQRRIQQKRRRGETKRLRGRPTD